MEVLKGEIKRYSSAESHEWQLQAAFKVLERVAVAGTDKGEDNDISHSRPASGETVGERELLCCRFTLKSLGG